jgi:hypothetical protein
MKRYHTTVRLPVNYTDISILEQCSTRPTGIDWRRYFYPNRRVFGEMVGKQSMSSQRDEQPLRAR